MNMRYFVGFLISIGLIILLIVLLFGGGGSENQKKVPTTKKQLDSYATTDVQQRLTIDGPINGQPVHQAVEITVDRHKVDYKLLTGYQGGVKTERIYTNNENAYSAFLHALSVAGYTRGDTTQTTAQDNGLGYCFSGNRYVFQTIDSNKVIQSYWSSSCGDPKTYLGNTAQTVKLFKAQVPDYSVLSRGTGL